LRTLLRAHQLSHFWLFWELKWLGSSHGGC
jgi:hypothetical protein